MSRCLSIYLRRSQIIDPISCRNERRALSLIVALRVNSGTALAKELGPAPQVIESRKVKLLFGNTIQRNEPCHLVTFFEVRGRQKGRVAIGKAFALVDIEDVVKPRTTCAGWRLQRRRKRSGITMSSFDRTNRKLAPFFDVDPVTGRSIEVFYCDLALETFGRRGAAWFWWPRRRSSAPDGAARGPFPTSYSAFNDALGNARVLTIREDDRQGFDLVLIAEAHACDR
jgi:hypothetical protein